jgi:hypothetical protein
MFLGVKNLEQVGVFASAQDGGIVSKTIFAPKSIDFSVLSFLCGPFPNFFQVDTTNTVLWTMPDHD